MTKCPRTVILSVALALALPAVWADPPAPPPPAAADDADAATLKQQLDETQMKLDAALHSYSQLENENDQLKGSADKDLSQLTTDKDNEIARVKGATNKEIGSLQAQVQALSDQVRHLRDQVADLAAENAQLKTRLALQAPPPRSATGPTRTPNP